MKIYTDQNVYEAAVERTNIIFDNFKHVYFSVSGGKDSSIMLQIAAQEARKRNRKIDVLYIDLEAQYKATIEHVEELREVTKDVVDKFYWCALPISLRNAVSVIQPKWICWDKKDKEKWVREMPTFDCVINEDNNIFPFFYRGMEFEEFTPKFAEWYKKIHNNESCAAGIGIRSNESLNRFRTIINDKKMTFKDYSWTTNVRLGDKYTDVYNFYPMYDWETEDIWIAVAKFDYKYNEIYELMYKNGLSIHEQRLCQPYGDDQRNGLDQFRALEYETWEKVLNRVHGVNFGNIYCRSSLLGNLKTEKPEEMTWEEYTVFLLESLGLYAPELRDHYVKKIDTFLKWYEEKEGLSIEEVPDVEEKKIRSRQEKSIMAKNSKSNRKKRLLDVKALIWRNKKRCQKNVRTKEKIQESNL